MLNLARYRLSNTTGYPVHPYFFTLPLCRPFFWNVKSMYEQKQMGLRQHHCRFIFMEAEKKWKRGKGKLQQLHSIYPCDIFFKKKLA